MTTTSRIRPLVAALAVPVVAAGCAADPESAKQAFVKSGDGYVAQKKFNEAIIQYKNAIQKDPKFGDARRKLAEVYLQAGDMPNATREYIRAADLLPDREDMQVKATSLLLLFGEFADAKTRAHLILTRNPKSSEGQILLGSALAGLKDLDGAVKEIEEAIKIDPVNGRAYASLDAFQSQRGNKDQADLALQFAQTAKTRLPLLPEVSDTLGWIYYKKDMMPQAIAALRDSIDQSPKNPLFHYHLGLAYIRSGDRPKARTALEEALRLSTNFPGAADARRQLGTL